MAAHAQTTYVDGLSDPRSSLSKLLLGWLRFYSIIRVLKQAAAGYQQARD
jgi:hypothetical protein